MVDWTLPKLLEIARKEDRARTAAQAAKAKLLNNMNNGPSTSIGGVSLNGKLSTIEPQIMYM